MSSPAQLGGSKLPLLSRLLTPRAPPNTVPTDLFYAILKFVADPRPDADAIRAQLDRLLASRGFAGAGRLSRFLRYVVERTLAGEGDEVKEYVVGVEVFDRREPYDPRVDSIVRVEAGRLRSKLDEYYIGEGADDEIRISLPRGGYQVRLLTCEFI